MVKPYKIVFFLIILLIIVINVLQLTWLFNSVQITKEQYKQMLDRCLSFANGKYEDIKREQWVNINTALPPVYIIGAMNQKRPANISMKQQGNTLAITTGTGSIIIDTLESYYAKAFWSDIATNNTFDIHLFDSLFKVQLHKHEIRTEYKLDTSRIVGNLTGAIDHMALKKYKDYPIQTWGISMGTFGRIVIWASFKPYPQYIFKNLLWILIINAVILIAGNTCLLYILKTLRKQKQATEVRNDFISNMTHELKTPVSVIATALDSLLEHKGIENKETTLTYLSISKEQTKNLSNLIEKILTTSIADETLILNKEPTNIVNLIENLLNKYEMPGEKNVAFDLQKNSNSIIVAVDKLHFTNVINNLVENAIKYSNEDVQINIAIADEKNKITIQVKDDGIGIEKRFHENIFEKFFRVPTGDLHSTKGTGLGLNYCKTIVEKHGGKILMTSVPAQGSAFFIEIPKHQHA
jgi:signal transduction histidine kinase